MFFTLYLTFFFHFKCTLKGRQQFLSNWTDRTLISVDSASWKLHQFLHQIHGPVTNPRVETLSRDSISGWYDCKADVYFTMLISPATKEIEQFIFFVFLLTTDFLSVICLYFCQIIIT